MKSPLSILGSNSTKESIIELISEKWPLSAKKIHNILRKDYHLSLTYQATHKALKELNQKKTNDSNWFKILQRRTLPTNA